MQRLYSDRPWWPQRSILIEPCRHALRNLLVAGTTLHAAFPVFRTSWKSTNQGKHENHLAKRFEVCHLSVSFKRIMRNCNVDSRNCQEANSRQLPTRKFLVYEYFAAP